MCLWLISQIMGKPDQRGFHQVLFLQLYAFSILCIYSSLSERGTHLLLLLLNLLQYRERFITLWPPLTARSVTPVRGNPLLYRKSGEEKIEGKQLTLVSRRRNTEPAKLYPKIPELRVGVITLTGIQRHLRWRALRLWQNAARSFTPKGITSA